MVTSSHDADSSLETVDIQIAFHMPEQPADALLLLLRHKLVTNKMIERDYRVGAEAKIVMHRLRELLKESVPEASVQSMRGVGYWIDDKTKATIIREARKLLPA